LRIELPSSLGKFFKSTSFFVTICKSFSNNLILSLPKEVEDDRVDKREGFGGPGLIFTRSLGGAGLITLRLLLYSMILVLLL
jgi:hypothetical protein